MIEREQTAAQGIGGKLKVAAYCRVSTETEEQKTSFDQQVETYTAMIEANPEWELAGIYADEGISGTSAEKRPEFMRMIRDCEEGKINLVITKSISRFARNLLDCITYMRKLNSIGVHIIFENNRIDTRERHSEMLLTVLASFAQEESRSISENTIWGIRKRFEDGTARWCRLYGYEKNKNGEYQIVPEQAEVSYYTSYIKANPEWEFAGVYSDEKSGTHAENRPGFQEMIQKALAGEIDYILVKSVSRFSRNMVDCQKYVDLLKGNGVYVRFEKENIDTEDPHSAMMFSFLSAIAQDESHSISENVKWSNQKRVQKGEYNLGNNRVFGYDNVNGKLVPSENASAVREIYRLFISGNSFFQIASAMEAAGVCGRSGKPLTPSGIMCILENEVYTGDKLLQKHAPKNFLTKEPENGIEYESNYLTNDHEPIVDRGTWQKAQELLKARREELDSGRIKYSSVRTHFLYGKVICGDCGSLMTRRTLRCTSRKDCKDNYKAWSCKDRHEGRRGNGCKMRNIREAGLLAEIAAQIGCADTEVEQKMDSIDRVIVCQDTVEVQQRG